MRVCRAKASSQDSSEDDKDALLDLMIELARAVSMYSATTSKETVFQYYF